MCYIKCCLAMIGYGYLYMWELCINSCISGHPYQTSKAKTWVLGPDALLFYHLIHNALYLIRQTHFGRTRMFAVFVASDTKINHCKAQKDPPCLQRTNQDCQCATLEILYVFYPTFFCKDATALFVCFLNFSKAIRLLPILHKSRDKVWNQTKVVIGNSLEIFYSFNYTNAQLDWFSRMLLKDIVAPAINVPNFRWIFHLKPCFNLRVKLTQPHGSFALPEN